MNFLDPFKAFFNENGILLFIILIVFVTGIISSVIPFIVVFITLIILRQNNQRETMLFLFMIILILSDNKGAIISYFKPLRTLVVLVLTAFTVMDFMSGRYKYNSKLNLLIPFFICCVIGMSTSPNFNAAMPRTVSYLFVPLIAYNYIKDLLLRKKYKLLLNIITFGNIICLVSLFYIKFFPQYAIYYLTDDNVRVMGIFGNPNGLGMYAMFLFTLVVFVDKYSNVMPKSYARFTFGLLLFILILSGSRTSLGSVVFFWGLFFTLTRSGFLRSFILYFIIPLGTSVVLILGIKNIIAEFGLSSRLRVSSLDDMGGRYYAWMWGYAQVPKNLYFGQGLNYDSYVYQENIPWSFRRINRGWNAAFSGVLAILLDAGVVGMLCMIFFIIYTFKKFRIKQFFYPMLIVVVLSSVFESWIVASLNPVMILFYTILMTFIYLPEFKRKKSIIRNIPSSIPKLN